MQKEFCANELCLFHNYKMNSERFYISSKSGGVGNTKLSKVRTNKLTRDRSVMCYFRLDDESRPETVYLCDVCVNAFEIKKGYCY